MLIPLISSVVYFGGLFSFTSGYGIQDRIYNGEEAELGQFPYQAAVSTVKPNGHHAFCGGSLISADYVLTAGHCLHEITSVKVVLGVIDRTGEDGVTYDNIPVENAIVKEDFNYEKLENDIALVKLPSPVNFTDNIKPIALAKKAWKDPNTFLGKMAVASGWGQTSSDGSIVRMLEYVHIKIMDNHKCSKQYKLSRSFGKKLICADRSIHKGTCKGDSGGPAAIEYNNEKYLIGLTSFNSGCNNEKKPDTFTNVAYFLDWIHEKTKIPIS